MPDNIHIPQLMQDAWDAYKIYSRLPLTDRVRLMKAVAKGLEAERASLIKHFMADSHLPEARANSELTRTIFQLNSYADAAVRGEWMQVSIDTGDPTRTPPKPDLRKTMVALGPVLVFGASNFPFAYSTAGGDTASAWAAGCPVIVKAHPAHKATSVAVANVIKHAITAEKFPKAVFTHVVTEDMVEVNDLITHPYVKAIGFTGSFKGGRAIWELANSRKEPIPMFAEMSSINPVYLLPGKLSIDAAMLATMLTASITLNAGQFCTDPGLIILIDGPDAAKFTTALGEAIKQVQPVPMLNPGIAHAFRENREKILNQDHVQLLAATSGSPEPLQDIPGVAVTTATEFLSNETLSIEVFGSFSLIVKCKSAAEMQQVAAHMEGQLTSAVMATEEDATTYAELLQEIQRRCGRFIFNQVPTGVEVCQAMEHGGPWPATTDSRFSSVGADAIKRFARPLSYQNWPDALLPPELKDSNPLGIFRTVNNTLTNKTEKPVIA